MTDDVLLIRQDKGWYGNEDYSWYRNEHFVGCMGMRLELVRE